MYNVANDSISTLGQTSIGLGTGVALATPDHTTQIVSVVIQILGLVLVFLRGRKQNLDINP